MKYCTIGFACINSTFTPFENPDIGCTPDCVTPNAQIFKAYPKLIRGLNSGFYGLYHGPHNASDSMWNDYSHQIMIIYREILLYFSYSFKYLTGAVSRLVSP